MNRRLPGPNRRGARAFTVSLCLLALGGCTLPQWWTGPPAAPLAPTAPALMVTAIPAYRLAIDRRAADLPTRLVVLHVRLSTSEESPLHFTAGDLAVRLADGGPTRIFDPPRAAELLRRAMLVDGDGDRPAGKRGPPGGLTDGARQHLTWVVIANLLQDGDVRADTALEGYVVVDTGRPLASLDGTSIEVTAHRLSDGSVARDTYRLAARGATSRAN